MPYTCILKIPTGIEHNLRAIGVVQLMKCAEPQDVDKRTFVRVKTSHITKSHITMIIGEPLVAVRQTKETDGSFKPATPSQQLNLIVYEGSVKELKAKIAEIQELQKLENEQGPDFFFQLIEIRIAPPTATEPTPATVVETANKTVAKSNNASSTSAFTHRTLDLIKERPDYFPGGIGYQDLDADPGYFSRCVALPDGVSQRMNYGGAARSLSRNQSTLAKSVSEYSNAAQTSSGSAKASTNGLPKLNNGKSDVDRHEKVQFDVKVGGCLVSCSPPNEEDPNRNAKSAVISNKVAAVETSIDIMKNEKLQKYTHMLIQGPRVSGKTGILAYKALEAASQGKYVAVIACYRSLRKTVEYRIEEFLRKRPMIDQSSVVNYCNLWHNKKEENNQKVEENRKTDLEMRKECLTAIAGKKIVMINMESYFFVGSKRTFDLVLIDEAQRNPENLSSIERYSKAVILFSNPAGIKYCKDKEHLDDQAFDNADYEKRLLVEQFQCQPEIMEWGNKMFFGSRLRGFPQELLHQIHSDKVKTLTKYSEDVKTLFDPIVFFNCSGLFWGRPLRDEVQYYDRIAEWQKSAESFAHYDEAVIVAKQYTQLLDGGVQSEDIAMIAPYKKQVECIKKVLETEFKIKNVDKLNIGTFDEFQDKKFVAVLVSCVRNNKNKHWGRLSDGRGLQTAMACAQNHLFLVGFGDMFKDSEEKHFRELYKILEPFQVKPSLVGYYTETL